MATTAYDGQMAFGATAVLTPLSGDTTPVTIDGWLDFDPPKVKRTEASYTPIDGDNAGLEQVVAGKYEKSDSSCSLVYTSARYNILMALVGVKCSFELTLNDGGVFTGAGCVMENSIQKLDDANIEKITFVIGFNGGSTFTPA